MSRAQAKEQVDMKDFRKTMEGIYTTSVTESTKDESPFVYKLLIVLSNPCIILKHIEQSASPLLSKRRSQLAAC